MKKLVLFFVALLISVLKLYSDEPSKIKVMTYNLRYGEMATMEEISGYIASEKPDIVALQECDWNTHRPDAEHQNGVRFMNDLAQFTDMFALYGKCINFSGGYYGIGILSKYPIVKSERVLLPNLDGVEQRALLVADVEMPDGTIVTFACTHLDYTSTKLRFKQLRYIHSYLKKSRNRVILAGDFNTEPDSREIRWISKRWESLSNDEYTFSSETPEIKIDYIYGIPQRGMVLESTITDGEVVLSDHRPIVSVVRLL